MNYLCDDDFVAKVGALVRISEIVRISEERLRSTFKIFGSHEPSHMTTREARSRTRILPPTLGFSCTTAAIFVDAQAPGCTGPTSSYAQMNVGKNDWEMEPGTAA